MKDEEPTGTSSEITTKRANAGSKILMGEVACLIALARDKNRSPTFPPPRDFVREVAAWGVGGL